MKLGKGMTSAPRFLNNYTCPIEIKGGLGKECTDNNLGDKKLDKEEIHTSVSGLIFGKPSRNTFSFKNS